MSDVSNNVNMVCLCKDDSESRSGSLQLQQRFMTLDLVDLKINYVISCPGDM